VTSPPSRLSTSALCRTRAAGMWPSMSLQPRKTGVPSRTGVVPRSVIGPDEPAAQAGYAKVAARVAGTVFQRQAGALGEAEQHRTLGRDPGRLDVGEHPSDGAEAGRDARLVPLHRFHEAVRVPGAAASLRRQEGDIGNVQLGAEGEDALRCRTASVEHHHRGAGGGERRTGRHDPLTGMRITAG